ncbi:MAG: ABC transporter permease [Gemmataceae bacterium]
MLRFLPYILRNIRRQRTRTLLTVSGAAVGMLVFTVVGAVRQGLAALSDDPASQRTLIVFQANRFCPFTSRMPESYAREIKDLPGVEDVIPIQVFTNNCRVSLDVIVFHGMPPDQVRQARTFDLVAGDEYAFRKNQDVALVGQSLAQRRGLSVGSRFSVGEVTVTVGGIFKAPRPADENFVYTHLKFLQKIRSLNSDGSVTQFEVLLKDQADPQEVARAIDRKYRNGPVATDTRTKGVFQARAVADLIEIISFTRYLGLACLGLIFALVATTTVMAVQDRIREHALLQTLGFSSPRLFGIVLCESLIVSLVGGCLGVLLGILTLFWTAPSIGTEGVMIAFAPSWSLALMGLMMTVAVAILAGLAPALQAARADIVASLRQV